MKYILILFLFCGCNIIKQTLNEDLEDVPPLAVTPIPDATPIPALSRLSSDTGNFLIEQIKLQLPNLDRAEYDMAARFCHKYKSLNSDQKAVVWAYLANAIIARESDYKPCETYKESDGTMSIGLFQLSYGDKFCPTNKAHGDLCDVKVNIACGVKIMGSLVADDRVVTDGGYVKYGAKPPRGLAKYWSVTRMPDKKSQHYLQEIMDKTKSAPGCI